MAMYTNIDGTSKELEYLRFNKDGAIQGITDAYANIDANSKKIFGTIKKSYWWKKYPCTEYELVKMAIGDVPYTTATSFYDASMSTPSVYKGIQSNEIATDESGNFLDGTLYVSDESVLNSFNKTTGIWENLFNYGSSGLGIKTGYFYVKAGDNDNVSHALYSDYTQCIFHGTFHNNYITIDYIYYIKPSKFSNAYSIINGAGPTNPSSWLSKEVEIDSRILPFDHYKTYWFDDATQIYYPIFSTGSFEPGLYEYLGYFA